MRRSDVASTLSIATPIDAEIISKRNIAGVLKVTRAESMERPIPTVEPMKSVAIAIVKASHPRYIW